MAHQRGGAGRRRGNLPQQEDGQGQAVGLDPLGGHYWQEYKVDRTVEIGASPMCSQSLLTCSPVLLVP